MLKSLFATGWQRLAIMFLVVWEIYWFIQWRAEVSAEKALPILIVSPAIALVAFLAGRVAVRPLRR